MVAGTTCAGPADTLAPLNPFQDLAPVPLDGRPREVTRDIAALGPLEKDQVIRLRVTGEGIQAVLILAEDPLAPNAGVLATGGLPGDFFDFRTPEARRYFVFVQFDPRFSEAEREAVLTVMPGDPNYRPPPAQPVLVVFAEGFLSEPGLFDPETHTPADRAFLASISGLVRVEVVARLREIFTGTPVQIFAEGDELPEAPISRLTYRPERVLAEDQESIDAALPPPDPARPECQVRLTFGEVLPHGTPLDPGNQNPSDEAVVYVGSFQGRGPACQTVILDSVNNIVLTLAQTGAHEIGHLIGLHHIEQLDIMNRSATLALQRQLTFERGQIQFDTLINGQVTPQVLTPVVQEPEFYFRATFDTP